MTRHLASIPLTALLALLAGCGGSSSNTAPLIQGLTAADASTLCAAAAAAGLATDAGFAQLYQNGAPIASLPRRRPAAGEAIADGVAMDATTLAVASGGPGTPAPQSLVVDAAAIAATSLHNASGTFTFVADTLAPDASPLPASWWHLQLTFDGQAMPFSIVDDDGGTATISGGNLDLYVKDATSTPTAPGNWTRIADVYSLAAPAHPLQIRIAPNGGNARSDLVTGLRHAHHRIVRSDDGLTATRSDAITVDGDASDLIASIPPVASLVPGSGPMLADGSGNLHLHASWSHQVANLEDTSVYGWIWYHWAAFTVTETKTSGTPLWTGIQATDAGQSFYLVRAGIPFGPFNRLQYQTIFDLSLDLTRSGQDL